MYKKGLLKITTPPCKTYDNEVHICDNEFEEGHTHYIKDSRTKQDYNEGCAYLPHSCNEWVIGGANQISEMIEDLQEILKLLQSK